MNDCLITLLPSDYCGHCSQVVAVAEEPSYERTDYVEMIENRVKVDAQNTRIPGGHAFNPTREQFTDQVDWKDIYGEQKALRLKRRK